MMYGPGMPEHKLYVAPASAPCRAVLLHHRLIGPTAPELEVVHVDLSAQDHPEPELLRNNPLHCVPTLVTPWGPLWESRSIMRYLESIIPEPRLYPTSVYHRAVVDRLLDWDLGSLYRAVSSIVYPQVFGDAKDPINEDLAALDRATRFLDDKQLGDGRAFLTGSAPTVADLSCAMTLSLLRLIRLELDDVPNMAAWQQRVSELDGFAEIDVPFQAWVDSLAPADEPPSDGDDAAEAADVPSEPAPEDAGNDAGEDAETPGKGVEQSGDAA